MSNETPPPMQAAPEVPAETSLAARLTNVFVAPGEVFAEVKASPIRHSNWLVAGLIFVLLSWCGSAVKLSQESLRHQMADIQEQAMQKSFQKQIDAGKMTQAQADQIKATAGKITAAFQIIGAIVGPFLLAAFAAFLGGFIIWAIGQLVFRKPFAYMKAVEASGLILIVAGLGTLVKDLLCAAMGSLFVSPGPILLVQHFEPTSFLHMTLLAFDVFAIWGTVLSGIALAKLSEVSFVKAFTWVFGVTFAIVSGMLGLSWALQHLAPK